MSQGALGRIYRDGEVVVRQGEAGDALFVIQEGQLEILCECGEPSCKTKLTLTIDEYDEAHRQLDRFIVAVEHEDPQIEQVVMRRDSYLIVDKIGEAERISLAEEQRRGTI